MSLSPARNGDVLAIEESKGLCCISAGGSVRWTISIPDLSGPLTPLSIDRTGELALLPAMSSLYCISMDGRIEWHLKEMAHRAVWCPDTDKAFVTDGFGTCYMVDRSGKKLWEFEEPGPGGGCEPWCTVAAGPSGHLYFLSGDTIYCFSAGGALLWKTDMTSMDSEPLIARDGSLVVTMNRGLGAAVLSAISPEGRVRWQQNLNSSAYWQPPLEDSQGTIYAIVSSGFLYSVDRLGKLNWQLQCTPTIDTWPYKPWAYVNEDRSIVMHSVWGSGVFTRHILWLVAPDGTVSYAWWGASPKGIFVDPLGNLYLWSRNGLIAKYDLTSHN